MKHGSRMNDRLVIYALDQALGPNVVDDLAEPTTLTFLFFPFSILLFCFDYCLLSLDGRLLTIIIIIFYPHHISI